MEETAPPFSSQVRTFKYNSRGQTTNEVHGSSTLSYTYDQGNLNGLGILTESKWKNATSWKINPNQLDAWSRPIEEAPAERILTARGEAKGARSVEIKLDNNKLSNVVFDPYDPSGEWNVDLVAGVGTHTLNAKATHPSNFNISTNQSFQITGDPLANTYDPSGNVICREYPSGAKQALSWDAKGRLTKVVQRDLLKNGFDWTAFYDGLGRRIRTSYTIVLNDVAQTDTSTIIDSWYDPLVEFLEIGVSVNGSRQWKIYGPDLNETHGGLQGVGGLEAIIDEATGATTGLIHDVFGNTLGSCSSLSSPKLLWSSVQVGGYGPLPGNISRSLSENVSLADATVWRGKRIDPTGFYYLGARYYEPKSARFLSADPLGHIGSMDLYSYANGDPINRIDPDGRVSKDSGVGNLSPAFENALKITEKALKGAGGMKSEFTGLSPLGHDASKLLGLTLGVVNSTTALLDSHPQSSMENTRLGFQLAGNTVQATTSGTTLLLRLTQKTNPELVGDIKTFSNVTKPLNVFGAGALTIGAIQTYRDPRASFVEKAYATTQAIDGAASSIPGLGTLAQVITKSASVVTGIYVMGEYLYDIHQSKKAMREMNEQFERRQRILNENRNWNGRFDPQLEAQMIQEVAGEFGF